MSVKKTRGYVEIRARLRGPVAANPALRKEHLVLVVTALGDTTMHAEFHLKSNVIYDISMREGRVAFSRIP